VYLGIDDRTAQIYAVKRIRLHDYGLESDSVAQAEREIRAMQTLQHPNIIQLREVLEVLSRKEVYLAMDFADKGTLEGLINGGQQLPQSTVLSIMKQICQAVKHLHNQGRVHQDIKPGNILLFRNGVAKLSDFGTSHSFGSFALTVGSPAFQAPEAIDEDPDDGSQHPEKEDIWALGVTLYQALFLRLPFEGHNLFEIVRNIKTNPVSIPAGTDESLAALIRSMLEVNPASRADINDVLAHPLIAHASPTTDELPEVLAPTFKEGDIMKINATVISEPIRSLRTGSSFAFGSGRNSWKHAPSDSVPDNDDSESNGVLI
jgi:serine/threonine protein kinase